MFNRGTLNRIQTKNVYLTSNIFIYTLCENCYLAGSRNRILHSESSPHLYTLHSNGIEISIKPSRRNGGLADANDAFIIVSG